METKKLRMVFSENITDADKLNKTTKNNKTEPYNLYQEANRKEQPNLFESLKNENVSSHNYVNNHEENFSKHFDKDNENGKILKNNKDNMIKSIAPDDNSQNLKRTKDNMNDISLKTNETTKLKQTDNHLTSEINERENKDSYTNRLLDTMTSLDKHNSKQDKSENPEHLKEKLDEQLIPNRHHDIECCEWTRGVDNLMARYKQDKDEIINYIESDPEKLLKIIWKQEGPLAIDNSCMCKMGKGDLRSPFSCAQCKNLKRLVDFKLGAIERPFLIECGQLSGKKMMVSDYEVSEPFLSWNDDAAATAKIYSQKHSDLIACGSSSIDNLKCITGDTFTTRTLIMWMIENMFSVKGLPHYFKLYTAFICKDIGYSLYDVPTIGGLSELHKISEYHNIDKSTTVKSQHTAYPPLKPTITRSIILQLLVILNELSSINFSHGTPSNYALIFNKEPISYMYDNVHIEGPVTLMLTDMWNSSATFNGVHYFSKNTKSVMQLEKSVFVPEIMTKQVTLAYCEGMKLDDNQGMICPSSVDTCPDKFTYQVCAPNDVMVYRLTQTTMEIYRAMRHIGFPLYVGSFDFYCFMDVGSSS